MCDCVSQHLPQHHFDRLAEQGRAAVGGLFKHGGTGDPCLNASWADFQALKFTDATLQSRASSVTRRQFTQTVKRWLPRAVLGWHGCASKRKRAEVLTEAEKLDAATILATPGKSDGGSRFWRSIEDALEHSPRRRRLSNLVDKSGLTHAAFAKMLLRDCRNTLAWGTLDRRDKLCADTLQKREAASAVWRGDRPWLVKDGRDVRVFDAEVDALHLAAPGCTYMYWHIVGIWAYRKIVFQYDAFTTDNKEGDTEPEQGFKSACEAHAPENAVARQSVGTAKHVMVYNVINGDLGRVIEPSVMHYGSSKTTGGKDNAIPWHKDDFPSWCAAAHACAQLHLWPHTGAAALAKWCEECAHQW